MLPQPGKAALMMGAETGSDWSDRHYPPELVLGGYDPAPRPPSLSLSLGGPEEDGDEEVEEEAVLLWVMQ